MIGKTITRLESQLGLHGSMLVASYENMSWAPSFVLIVLIRSFAARPARIHN